MVAKKLIENWIYWFVIDFISVFLFLTRDLYLTAGLFIVYLIIVVFGYKTWKKSMIENRNGAADSNRQLR
jgi:nicotinamide mononucleotide transporter